ncbi:MAG: hypothetical protein H0T85_08010 [Geodermatophilaceae bacterium]|nr:hypothetical protein [Geodermatophilaceae bacterium]
MGAERVGRYVAVLVCGVLALTACSATSAPNTAADRPTASSSRAPTTATTTAPATTAAATSTTPAPELPGGGRTVFPDYRLVGFSGGPGSAALGPLTGDLDAAARRLTEQAAPYGGDRPVLPVFELIATIAHPFPTAENDFSGRAPDATIGQHLDAARRHGALLLLNIQPGRADFLPEVRAYEKWLREPDVGVALDPEWAVGPEGIPGEVYGQTTGVELNAVADYLGQLVRDNNLPQKVMVYHQVASQVVVEIGGLLPHPNVAIVQSVDGIGSRGAKEATWRTLMQGKPRFVVPGFKLFYEEDVREGPLMTPEQVLALAPLPEYVLYE